MDPQTLLASLKKHLTSQSALTRSTVVTAIKFTISDQVMRLIDLTIYLLKFFV
jgi:hypothetical protein